MIIARTPFRISFAGGGTDFPEWFSENRSVVISGTINKYSYLTCRNLENFFEHNYRIVYSIIENKFNIDEIEHPAVKAILNFMKYSQGLEIHHDGDLPARTGLGSSSAFTVGLIHIVNKLKSIETSKKELSDLAIHVERKILKEKVGMQDQVACAFGGLNRVDFYTENGESKYQVIPLKISRDKLDKLSDQIVLVYTGVQRFSSEVSEKLIDGLKAASKKTRELNKRNVELALMTEDILINGEDLNFIADIFEESWSNKAQLNPDSINDSLIAIKKLGLENGSTGAKILGAGGGGFMAFWVPLQNQAKFDEAFKKFVVTRFKFEKEGSKIIYDGYNEK